LRRSVLVGTAALGASSAVVLCDSASQDNAPKFRKGAQRYDEATYVGRLYNILNVIDPRTLFVSDSELRRCQALLAAYDASGDLPPGADDEAMWGAKKTVDAIIHHPTGEKMLVFGRMSAFVPMNLPIAAGMLIHGPTGMAAGLFWQWANQSYNVLNNYCNRAGKEIEMGPLMQSYCLAVCASASIAVGSGALIKAKPALARLGPFIPYLAVITAGSCNVAFTRLDEIKNGVVVSDEHGKQYGLSKAAGKLAVFKTVTTRSCFLPIFPLLIPPTVMALMPLTPGTMPHNLASLGVITVCLATALPMALALEPGQMEMDATSLEEEFWDLKDAQGNPVKVLYASKGM